MRRISISKECQTFLENLNFDAIFTSIHAFKIKWRINGAWIEPSIEDIIRIIENMFHASTLQSEVTFSCFRLIKTKNNLIFRFTPVNEYIEK